MAVLHKLRDIQMSWVIAEVYRDMLVYKTRLYLHNERPHLNRGRFAGPIDVCLIYPESFYIKYGIFR